ncbi:cyclic nucleotide-binding domain-containing protein [Massilia sp. TS11]|uniref:cyclic nucleotide-binding domain-containing protein n=1 Tax=Massilia sp. TS11 TaxID=2908003 RepID=UPI001EDAB5A4|nr:cyclic nucleotide-binding domain-containing protein [Massilia sp. TS11]
MRKVLFILSELLDDDVDWLAANGERAAFASGSELIGLGTRVDSLFFVLDGQVEVVAGSGAVIVTLGSGEVLGEMSLVDPAKTTAAVRAKDGVVTLRLPHAVLREKLAADPAFAARFYRALAIFLSDRVRNTTRRFGYGGNGPAPDKAELEEINEELVDKIYLAGTRFDRMLKKLAG